MTDHTSDIEMREFAQVLDRVFAASRGDDHRSVDPARLDRELWSTLVELGVTRLTGPESEGGAEAGWAEASHLLIGSGSAAAAVPIVENDLLAGWLLQLSQSDRIVTGPTAIRTAAVLDPDGCAVNVPWARAADSIVVLWERDRAHWVAEIAGADVEVTENVNLAGEPRDHIRVDLSRINGYFVASGVGIEFQRRGALARALTMAGAMQRVVELVVEHTTARTQFGRPLGRFQAVQHMVANIAAESALTRAAAEAAVSASERFGFDSAQAGFAIAAAKSCAGHAASAVVRDAHQCLGAIGFTAEHELHRHTNRLLAWRSEFGSVHYWDAMLLDGAIDTGPSGLWPMITD